MSAEADLWVAIRIIRDCLREVEEGLPPSASQDYLRYRINDLSAVIYEEPADD